MLMRVVATSGILFAAESRTLVIEKAFVRSIRYTAFVILVFRAMSVPAYCIVATIGV